LVNPSSVPAGRFGADSPIGAWLRSTETPTSNFSQSTTSSPFITKDYQGIQGLAKGLVESRLASGGSLPAGFKAGGLRDVNRAFAGTPAAAENMGAAFGFGPGAAAGGAAMDVGRRGQIADFLTQVPMMERQNQTQDIGLANAMTEAFGKGTKSTISGQSYTTGQLAPGQEFLLNSYLQGLSGQYLGQGPGVRMGAGQAIGTRMQGLGQMLTFLNASGAFNRGSSSGTAFNPVFSGGSTPGAMGSMTSGYPGQG